MNHRILTRFFVALGIAWFVLWACAPMSSNPPPTPMPEAAKYEFGFGANGGARVDSEMRCKVESVSDDGYPQCDEFYKDHRVTPVGNLQGSVRIAAGSDLPNEGGLLFQIGFPPLLSAGGYYRHSLVRNDTISVGWQVELGLFWAGTSLPVAYRVSDSFWLTTMPGLHASFDYTNLHDSQVAHVPIGLSWQFNDIARLDTEIGTNLEEGNEDSYDYNAYGHMGISIAK